MKKTIAILLALVLCVGLLAGCAKKPEEKPVFVHGFDRDFPPFTYIDDAGNTAGFDVELCQAACELLGWEYQPYPLNWDTKQAELESDACDCIWSGFTRNGLEEDYLWSKTYSRNTQMILVAEDSGIKTLEDLAGKLVGVQTNTSAYNLLNDPEGAADLTATFASLEVYDTYTVAFNALKAGAIDAVAIDITSGEYLIRDETGFVFLEEMLGDEEYAIGFRKGDTELCDKINEALDQLVANGKYAELGEKYGVGEFLCLGK